MRCDANHMAVTAGALKKLEREFGVSLPKDYVAFLSNYPVDLDEVNEDAGNVEAASDLYILNSADRLQSFNEEVRDPEMTFPDDPWPKHLFVIGHDGCGNYYAIDTTKEKGAIWLFDGDDLEFQHVSADIAEFDAYVRELMGLPEP